ncbi:HIT domain-containing protein [Chloroflexota bacterium]
MDYLWAPWRIEYIKIAKEEAKKGCILCSKPAAADDRNNLILHRGKHSFIIMNAYPYNSGHLMVAPKRHVANLEDLEDAERNELFAFVSHSIAVMKKTFNAEGFNVGMNLGRIAGAGIDTHIHAHVVPRWVGDTNFMPVTGDIRIVNEAILETYDKLVGKF